MIGGVIKYALENAGFDKRVSQEHINNIYKELLYLGVDQNRILDSKQKMVFVVNNDNEKNEVWVYRCVVKSEAAREKHIVDVEPLISFKELLNKLIKEVINGL